MLPEAFRFVCISFHAVTCLLVHQVCRWMVYFLRIYIFSCFRQFYEPGVFLVTPNDFKLFSGFLWPAANEQFCNRYAWKLFFLL